MDIEYMKSLDSLITMVPNYVENYGKVTQIYLKGGEVKEVDFSFSKVLRDYCGMNYLNFEQIRKASATITGSRGMVPLYIRPDKILLPFRVFPAKVDTDRSFAYVNIKEVDKLDPDKKYLIFNSGQRIDFFDSKNCVLKKMGQSQLLGKKITF